MRFLPLCAAVGLFASVSLLAPMSCAAQDPSGGPPDPRVAAHDVLRKFVGTWDVTMRTAMPGAPAVETKATARCEPICNGLWLKSVVDSATPRPFQAISLTGWDAAAKTYVSVWVDSSQPSATRAVAIYDAKNGTWSSKTISGHGPSRSVIVWKDADTMVETGYVQDPSGRESVCLEVTRQRRTPGTQPAATTAATTAAGSTGSIEPAAETRVDPASGTATTGGAATSGAAADQNELRKYVGTWDVVMKVPQPDGQVVESKGAEVNSAVCGGAWMWSDFESTMLGAPYEGHGLIGYDASRALFVTYWVDSTTPYLIALDGKIDPSSRTITYAGTMRDSSATEVPMTQKLSWTAEDTRVAEFAFKSAAGATSMEILYTRKHSLGGYEIK